MPEYDIGGIRVQFPFEPYEVQRAYMEKVIACLSDSTNGVLESPTGTGKTLSLLCSSLAWVLFRKSELQRDFQKNQSEITAQLKARGDRGDPLIAAINAGSTCDVAINTTNNWSIPKVIYASRTHSQLTQAMQELKRSAYSFMRSVVLGSRDQLCIHPEVMREEGNSNKIQMCKLRVQTKTCSFQSRVESKKDHPDFRGPSVMDIEDLVNVGQKLKICPYYASKELVSDADIIFMPYNYLLDPKALKANKIELNNTIIILDEAHNIEKICEESASVQIRSSDVAMAIEDVTHIMKAFSESQDFGSDEPKDFSLEDLALVKEMLLDLEKAIDQIVVENLTDGVTLPASFMYELMAKANFTYANCATILGLLDKLLQFLLVASQNGAFRKGGSLQILSNLLSAVFTNKEEMLQKVYRSFKVHVEIEESKQQNPRGGVKESGWLVKASTSNNANKSAKVINYWCFNPGFGMEQLLNRQVRSIILTSGTLAPLKPLIAELAIPVAQYLENPHIVSPSQVYVKIISSGPDREQLISNYKNRDNPKYIRSLGQTVLNVARIVPDGLLVFFPSYPLLNQCVNAWQASGLWVDISSHKPIYVEPRSKYEFTTVMEEFYKSIRDGKGACFMAVCRGKVSEGLDFADNNGRAVIITGLPFPPLKDPKVILKKRYLEDNRTKENELLSGQDWYNLDATRAVNQAIGRVIRHRHDYGAILLCDARFQYPSQVQQLSKWIRGHLGNTPKSSTFGPIVRELREFFKNAEKTLPTPKARNVEACDDKKNIAIVKDVLEAQNKFHCAQNVAMKIENANTIKSWSPDEYAKAAGRPRNIYQVPSAIDFISRLDGNVSSIDFNSSAETMDKNCGLVKIYKRERSSPTDSFLMKSNNSPTNMKPNRPKRYKLVDNNVAKQSCSQLREHVHDNFNARQNVITPKVAPEDRSEFLRVLRSALTTDQFGAFTKALFAYKQNDSFEELFLLLSELLGKPKLRYMLLGMRRFLKNEHKNEFDLRLVSIDDRPGK